jgi:ERF superfamily protein
MSNELVTTTPQPELSIGSLMERVIQTGITPDSVSVLERMMALHERNQAKMAEQEFAKAFAALQRDMPKIHATRPVESKGVLMYKFAPYEDIMTQAKPLLSEHGFAVSFDTKWEDARIIVTCTLMHTGGHSKSNSFAARVGNGPPNASAGQADMAVKTLAKRGALCDALNIVVEHDTDGDDARIEGCYILPEQAQEIFALLRETKSDLSKFLTFAKADSIEKICSARFDDVRDMLVRKKRKASVPDPKATDPDQPWG